MKRLHLMLLFFLTAPALKAEQPFVTTWLVTGNSFTIPTADGATITPSCGLKKQPIPNSGMQPHALPVMEDQCDAGVVLYKTVFASKT